MLADVVPFLLLGNHRDLLSIRDLRQERADRTRHLVTVFDGFQHGRAERHGRANAPAGGEFEFSDTLQVKRVGHGEQQVVALDPQRNDIHFHRGLLIDELDGGVIEDHTRQVHEGDLQGSGERGSDLILAHHTESSQNADCRSPLGGSRILHRLHLRGVDLAVLYQKLE